MRKNYPHYDKQQFRLGDEGREMQIRMRWPVTLADWTAFLDGTGLDPATAVLALALGHYAEEYGLPSVYTISAKRDPAWAAAAQKRWDRGNRVGLAVRPVTDSWHNKGRAFDVAPAYGRFTAAEQDLLGEIGEALGLRWGGRFKTPDPNHFDLPW